MALYTKFSLIPKISAVLDPLCGFGDPIKFCKRVLTTSYFFEDLNNIKLEEDKVTGNCLSRRILFVQNAISDVDLPDVLLACPYIKMKPPESLMLKWNPAANSVKEVVYVVRWRVKFETGTEKGILLFKDIPAGFFTKMKTAVTNSFSTTNSHMKNIWPQRSGSGKDAGVASSPVLERNSSIKEKNGNVMLVAAYRHKKPT